MQVSNAQHNKWVIPWVWFETSHYKGVPHALISAFLWNVNSSESNLEQQNISVLVFYLSRKAVDKKDYSVFICFIIKKVAEKAEQKISW